MNIYLDRAVYAGNYPAIKAFDLKLEIFKVDLKTRGVEVLDFSTSTLPFNPHTGEIADFVQASDAVVALAGHPSVGFSFAVREATDRLGRARFLFVQHEIDVVLVHARAPMFFARCLYQTPGFPAQVLLRYFKTKDF